MSWECKYNVNNYCTRLKRDCSPGIKGCILYGRITDYSNDTQFNSKSEKNIAAKNRLNKS